MNGASHAKNAKGAKDCIEKNKRAPVASHSDLPRERTAPCSVALGVKKRVLMRSSMEARKLGSSRKSAPRPVVRGGSTVLVVKPLGRSRGEWRLLLTGFVS
jgi:hypothetical protein